MDLKLLEALNEIDGRYISQALSVQKAGHAGVRKVLRRVLLVSVLLLLITTAAAVVVTRGDFFMQWLLSPKNLATQEPYLISEDSELILDTQTVRIEAVGAIKSGHVIRAGFLVTMKNLDTALAEEALPTIKGYTIGDIVDSKRAAKSYEYGTYYASDGIDLLENQFLNVVSGSFSDDGEDEIEFTLTDIGYFSAETGNFVPYLEDTWTWSFTFDEIDQTGRSIQINERGVTNSGVAYRVESISISSLGCRVVSYLEQPEEAGTDILEEFLSGCSIQLTDGTNLCLHNSGYSSKADGIICVEIIFDMPLSINRIDHICFMGGHYNI